MAEGKLAGTNPNDRQLLNAILTLAFCRIIVNMTRRFTYAFIPAIARGLGAPLTSVQNVIAVQSGIGVTSPLFGPLSDRYGRKRVMIAVLVIMAISGGMGALFPQFWMFAIMMIAFGAGKMIFDPAMQAYLGDRVPYRRRALAIGTTELSWAASLFLAAPLIGFLLEVSTLRIVFALLGLLCLLAAIIIFVRIEADHTGSDGQATPRRLITPFDTLKVVRGNPAASGALIYSWAISAANEIFFINYSVFMESAFGLALTAIGALTVVIAAAELTGEFAIMGLADRFGKRRLTMIGIVVSSLTYLILPYITGSLILAMMALFVMFLFVEIGIVGAIPIFTEVAPNARSAMMSGVIGAASFGRLSGGIIGSLLYTLTQDFQIMSLIAGGIGLLGAMVMWRMVHEQTD